MCHVLFFLSFPFFSLQFLRFYLSILMILFFFSFIISITIHILNTFLEVTPGFKYLYNQLKCSLLRQYRNHSQSLGSILTSLPLSLSQNYCCYYSEEHTVRQFHLPSHIPSLKLFFLYGDAMYLLVCAVVFGCVHMYRCEGQRPMYVITTHFSWYFLKQGLSQNLQLTDSVMLVTQ